ncbi:MAG: hypothetical protein OXU23_16970 [Candidatus Poribacteria bacterium]|nr:hypothetical protein [Candidatus Poribacteria bacterium]
MFMQKFKASLRFLGILFLRILAGIVVGYLWFIAVALIFQFTGENVVSQHAEIGPHRGLYDYFDSKYNTDSPIFPIVAWVAFLGNLGCIVLGIFWGFSQGRLDLRRQLRKRHA